MSIKFWDKGSVFPTIISDGNLRVYFASDLYFDVDVLKTSKDFVMNNRIPVGDICLLSENPDGEIVVGWMNGEVKFYNSTYGDFFRLVGLTRFNIQKVMEDNLEVLDVGTCRLSTVDNIKVTRSDMFRTRYYILKNNPNFLIMDVSDGNAPIIIDIKKNPELTKKVIMSGTEFDPLFIRQGDIFEDAATGQRIVEPVIIPQPRNNPRFTRRII